MDDDDDDDGVACRLSRARGCGVIMGSRWRVRRVVRVMLGCSWFAVAVAARAKEKMAKSCIVKSMKLIEMVDGVTKATKDLRNRGQT